MKNKFDNNNIVFVPVNPARTRNEIRFAYKPLIDNKYTFALIKVDGKYSIIRKPEPDDYAAICNFEPESIITAITEPYEVIEYYEKGIKIQ